MHLWHHCIAAITRCHVMAENKEFQPIKSLQDDRLVLAHINEISPKLMSEWTQSLLKSSPIRQHWLFPVQHHTAVFMWSVTWSHLISYTTTKKYDGTPPYKCLHKHTHTHVHTDLQACIESSMVTSSCHQREATDIWTASLMSKWWQHSERA